MCIYIDLYTARISRWRPSRSPHFVFEDYGDRVHITDTRNEQPRAERGSNWMLERAFAPQLPRKSAALSDDKIQELV